PCCLAIAPLRSPPPIPYTPLFRSEVAAAEPEAERHGRLGLVGERGVVELELVQGVAQHGVVRAVHREEPGVDHRLRVAVLADGRSEEHTSELQSRENLVCRLLLEK